MVAATLILAFAVLKRASLHPAISDENLYFYAAGALARGSLPYRDYFLAHPPLGLVLDLPLVWLLAPDVGALKGIPLCWTAAAGVCVFIHARRVAGDWAGVFSLALFLTPYLVLSTSSFHTGADVVVALIAAGMVAQGAQRPAVAGVLAGAAVGVRLYAAPLAFVLLFSGGRTLLLRALLGCGAVLLVVLGLPALLSGHGFLDPVVAFQLGKQARSGWQVLLGGVWDAPALFAAALLGIPVALRRPDSWQRRWLVMTALGLVAFVLAPHAFPYHLLPCAVPLALMGGAGIAGAAHVLQQGPHAPQFRRAGAGLVLVFGLAAVGIPLTEHALRQTPGRPYWGVMRYAASQMGTLPAVDRMARHLLAHSRQGDTVAGSSGLAPLLALMTGLPVALPVVDSNPQRFGGNPAALAAALDALGQNPPRWMASTDPGGWLALPPAQRFLTENYHTVLELYDPLYGQLRLLEHNAFTTPPQPG